MMNARTIIDEAEGKERRSELQKQFAGAGARLYMRNKLVASAAVSVKAHATLRVTGVRRRWSWCGRWQRGFASRRSRFAFSHRSPFARRPWLRSKSAKSSAPTAPDSLRATNDAQNRTRYLLISRRRSKIMWATWRILLHAADRGAGSFTRPIFLHRAASI